MPTHTHSLTHAHSMCECIKPRMLSADASNSEDDAEARHEARASVPEVLTTRLEQRIGAHTGSTRRRMPIIYMCACVCVCGSTVAPRLRAGPLPAPGGLTRCTRDELTRATMCDTRWCGTLL